MAWAPLLTLCAALFGALAATLLAAPGVVFWLFSLDPQPSASVMARRAGALFAGLAVLSALSRGTPPAAAARCARHWRCYC